MNKIFIAINTLVILGSFSCSLKKEDIAPYVADLVIEPRQVITDVHAKVAFSANGGLGRYHYSVVKGSSSISPETGLLTDLQPGQTTVRVTDVIGNMAEAIVTVNSDFALKNSLV